MRIKHKKMTKKVVVGLEVEKGYLITEMELKRISAIQVRDTTQHPLTTSFCMMMIPSTFHIVIHIPTLISIKIFKKLNRTPKKGHSAPERHYAKH